MSNFFFLVFCSPDTGILPIKSSTVKFFVISKQNISINTRKAFLHNYALLKPVADRFISQHLNLGHLLGVKCRFCFRILLVGTLLKGRIFFGDFCEQRLLVDE